MSAIFYHAASLPFSAPAVIPTPEPAPGANPVADMGEGQSFQGTASAVKDALTGGKRLLPGQRLSLILELLKNQEDENDALSGSLMDIQRGVKALVIKNALVDDTALAINPPYGLLGIALNSSPPQIRRMVDYCERQKIMYAQMGDIEQSRMSGELQTYLMGMLNGLTQVSQDPLGQTFLLENENTNAPGASS